jgi:hypothetical protein
MDLANDSISDARIRKLGTREEVFKGLAARTAGGLKKDDIIAKQFGAKTLYISKRLSDRMRENFHNTNFKKRVRKTLVATTNTQNQESITKNEVKLAGVPHGKTQKLSFKVNDNTVRNVYYKELQGMNLQKLKDELKKEETEEDLGIPAPREFKIENVPDISLDDLI